MYLVGLTGGIAAGKSTVAEVWENLGADIVDADILAREVVEAGSIGLAALVSAFGSEILDHHGALDRKVLAGLVFSDPAKRQLVESILHPLIRSRSFELIGASTAEIVVYVIPLLIETNSDLDFDFVVTVEAPIEKQIERMVEIRGMTAEEAKSRIKAQASAAERANRADRILNSNQDLNLLKADAKRLFKELLAMASAKEASNG